MQQTSSDLEEIMHRFAHDGQIDSIAGFGSGHINDTFRVVNRNPAGPDYLLQRINHLVFPDVGPMMNNIRQVTEHLRSKTGSRYTSLTIVPTINGELYTRDGRGNYWRVFHFLKGLISYDVAETPEQIYEGGKAFGAFLRDLADFPAGELFPTIRNFHHVPWRIGNLQRAVQENVADRVKQARPLIDYALEIANEMCRIQKLGDAGKIPLRVTHNDTKFNNVLLDQSGRGRCVIDLDTVMPGFVHFDFGDAVRTSVSRAPEDEPDLQKIEVDLERYRALVDGYLEPTRSILNEVELQYLPLSGAMLAYIMGIRFLTDFLSADVYYKIHFPNHNHQRAAAQLELTRKLLRRIDDLMI